MKKIPKPGQIPTCKLKDICEHLVIITGNWCRGKNMMACEMLKNAAVSHKNELMREMFSLLDMLIQDISS